MRFQAKGITVQVLIAALFTAVGLCGCPSEEKTLIEQYLDPLDPFGTNWGSSAHADATAAPFNHWNSAGSIEARCAKCHSTPGFLDFLGADGTAASTVENAAPVGTVIHCDACHNDVVSSMTSVTFPSGSTVTGLGHEAVCLQCHQGIESGADVEAHITAISPATDDTVDPGLRSQVIHYRVAGVTRYGNEAKGAYQYAGKRYDGRHPHVLGRNTCIDCHDKHTLDVKVAACASCHPGVTNPADLKDIRMAGSFQDFDGDGDTAEGTYHEVDGMRAIFLGALQAYCAAVSDPIVFDADTYPHFFVDTNLNGTADPSEIGDHNRYMNWTARAVRTAYNYLYSWKDPGAFAHNPKYIIQILYDSIEDLHGHTPVSGFANLHRTDSGHFDGTAEAYRHWDSNPGVDGACARCHTPEGFREFLANGGSELIETVPPSYGMTCEACHTGTDFLPGSAPRINVEDVKFPSGAVVSSGESNICMTCHQGRHSTDSVNAHVDAAFIPGDDNDDVNYVLGFQNVHYYAAGATRMGSEVRGGYQYSTVTIVVTNTSAGSNFQVGEVVESLANEVIGTVLTVSTSDNITETITLTDVYGGFQVGDWVTGQTSAEAGLAVGVEVNSNLYDAEFPHVSSYDECADCHDVHTHRIKTSECATCHGEVGTATTYAGALLELQNIRQMGSFEDYDGDGNVTEGIHAEISGLRDILYLAIREYAMAETDPIVYGASNYPHWFYDTDSDGVADAGETIYPNGFKKWTPRLLKAAYNYQFSLKDPGAFAHNAKYVIALLYDSIADLNSNSNVDVDDLNPVFTGVYYSADFVDLVRNDSGHFDYTAEAYRHWDEDFLVSTSCARCHTSSGVSSYFANGTDVTSVQNLPQGMTCDACHTGTNYLSGAPLKSDVGSSTSYPGLETITFPGGNTVSVTAGDSSGICGACHQGRQSTADVDSYIAGKAPATVDTVDSTMSFRNVHYLPAAAIQQGSVAAVGYEYTTPTYASLDTHSPGTACTYCHGP
ncbi:MAG: hypothetical protein ACYTFG_11965, partial [Planctomycetota bacterium]